MIEFRNVSKYYITPRGRKTLLSDFSMTIPAGAKVALMGRNGAGKSTMIGMISGTVPPNSGNIRRSGSMSWPMGFSGSFAADITGRQNALFVARIYGVDAKTLLNFVEDFAELGGFIDMPVRSYSSGMKARLAFGLSMGLGFDWYLVDEVTSVGDTSFRKKSLDFFRNRLQQAGLIMVSHSVTTLREYCDCGIVLEGGNATYYSDLEEAIIRHEENMDQALTAAGGADLLPDGETLFREAKRHSRVGDYIRAEEYVVRALQAQPDNAAWYAFLGDVIHKLDDNAAAVEAYQRAIELRNEPQYHVALSQIYGAEGYAAEAEAELRTALWLDPNNLMANYALGRFLYRKGEVDEAEQMLRRVVAEDPDNAGAHRVLAQICDTRKDHALALTHHANVARLMPESATFLTGYARALDRCGDAKGAEAIWNRILSLDPKSEEARNQLRK